MLALVLVEMVVLELLTQFQAHPLLMLAAVAVVGVEVLELAVLAVLVAVALEHKQEAHLLEQMA
jgi:hypothetical protein